MHINTPHGLSVLRFVQRCCFFRTRKRFRSQSFTSECLRPLKHTTQVCQQSAYCMLIWVVCLSGCMRLERFPYSNKNGLSVQISVITFKMRMLQESFFPQLLSKKTSYSLLVKLWMISFNIIFMIIVKIDSWKELSIFVNPFRQLNHTGCWLFNFSNKTCWKTSFQNNTGCWLFSFSNKTCWKQVFKTAR